MRKIILTIVLLCSISFSQSITWTERTSNYSLPQGIKIFKGERNDPKLNIYYIDVDMNNPDLVIHPYIDGNSRTINNFVPFVGAYAGVNGGFFGGSSSLSSVVYPFEVKSQNVTSVTRFSQSYPVIRSFFGMNSDRSFNVNWIYHFGNNLSDLYKFNQPMPYTNNQQTPLPAPLKSSGTPYENVLVGIGGAPTLVKNGQINVTYNQEIMWGSGVGYDNRDPRTAVGFTANNHVIMIVADGRQTISEGVGLPELAQIMIDLGCIEAMNLDGGGSTQMAVGGQYVNTPSETRAVPTILTVTHKDSLKLPLVPQFEKVIDTGDPEASLFGSGWFASANPGYWGGTPAQLNQIGVGNDYAEFRPLFPADAQYELYGWWVASSNRSKDTPFIIQHKYGKDTVRVDQTKDDAKWNLIGTYNFSPDTSQKICISDAASTGTYIVADAIRFLSYDPATSIDPEQIESPNYFSLQQNYPNPFNPVTTIKFSIPALTPSLSLGERVSEGRVRVTLKIYDVLGREIAILVNEEKAPGNYEVKWDASGFPSGIYFYRLAAGSFTETKKMVLLR